MKFVSAALEAVGEDQAIRTPTGYVDRILDSEAI